MKKIVSILTVAVLLVACLSIGAFAADDAVVTVEEAVAEVGDTVTLKVSISEATFRAYGVKLVYDAAALELTAIEAGALSEKGMFSAPITSGIVGFVGNADQTAAGVLFTATFKVLAEGKHEVTVAVDGFTKSDNTNLAVTVDGGCIDVAHVHEWVKGETVEPWCTTKGYTVYNCACGESEKRDWVDALDHDWVFVELVENGELYECSRCHEQYIEAVTGDVIGVVVALLAVSGLGITVLKKKEN